MTAVQPGRLPRATATAAGSLRTGARDTSHPAVQGPAVLSYYLVGGATLLLLALGVVMVLSASSITSIRATGSPYGQFVSQATFALVGVPLMVVASRIPVRWYRKLAWPALGLGLLLQALILTPLGLSEKGNTNWIFIPGTGQSIQPSEFLKLALAVWLGLVLARKAHLLHRWQHVLVPGIAVAVLALGLVLVGRDLGTAMVVALVVAGAMFVAGVPLKWFGAAVVGAAAVVSFLVISSPNRMQRITAVFGGECDESAACYQTLHGLYGLGTGGISGLGLGASREKWAYLPEAHNDYIFAIIGEELGLWGTLLVLGLFAALATGMFR
ncbi:MAG TPA: FtsW/RodA/SpoVE family cell cycle protein, partial [Phototrophicaceae bacterium]|nr:FtsW/RodA/SpoVE family cell cycle protein [Phototrophicaceae bacterium]